MIEYDWLIEVGWANECNRAIDYGWAIDYGLAIGFDFATEYDWAIYYGLAIEYDRAIEFDWAIEIRFLHLQGVDWVIEFDLTAGSGSSLLSMVLLRNMSNDCDLYLLASLFCSAPVDLNSLVRHCLYHVKELVHNSSVVGTCYYLFVRRQFLS